MKKLLTRYLKHTDDNRYIIIIRREINGAICFVEYYTDENKTLIESKNINVWDMLVFLNDV